MSGGGHRLRPEQGWNFCQMPAVSSGSLNDDFVRMYLISGKPVRVGGCGCSYKAWRTEQDPNPIDGQSKTGQAPSLATGFGAE